MIYIYRSHVSLHTSVEYNLVIDISILEHIQCCSNYPALLGSLRINTGSVSESSTGCFRVAVLCIVSLLASDIKDMRMILDLLSLDVQHNALAPITPSRSIFVQSVCELIDDCNTYNTIKTFANSINFTTVMQRKRLIVSCLVKRAFGLFPAISFPFLFQLLKTMSTLGNNYFLNISFDPSSSIGLVLDASSDSYFVVTEVHIYCIYSFVLWISFENYVIKFLIMPSYRMMVLR